MSTSRSLPERVGALVDDSLLKLIREANPLKFPRPGQPVDAVFFEAGKQALIEWLGECQRAARKPS